MVSEFTEGVSTRLSKQSHRELSELAKREQRSLSNMVRVLLTEALFYRKMGLDEKTLEEFLKTREPG